MNGKMGEMGKTILVIDDDADVAVALATMLELEGYRTMEARSADEAMKRMAARRPDLITVDLMMPRKSGLMFYRSLMLDPRYRELPVIFISAFSGARDFSGPAFRKLIEEAEVPEPAGFIEKPVVPERLLALVQSVLQASKEN